jgi:hypothetical protein
MLVLMALTVQLSISMLEFAGPGSSETRTRLATTIVAAAHRGVFTEPDRPQGDTKARERVLEAPAPVSHATPSSEVATSIQATLSPWSTGLAPPKA